MNKFNNFFDKAPLWQIYIIGWIFSSAFTTLIGYVLFNISEQTVLDTSFMNMLKFGSMMGLVIGLMFTLMISMSRSSQKFWNYAKEVEKLIDEADSREKLDSIFKNEFQELRRLYMGRPHDVELQRLYTTMKTKYKYIK